MASEHKWEQHLKRVRAKVWVKPTGERPVHEVTALEEKARPEGFEPPLSQIRSLRLYPLSYGRAPRGNSREAEFLSLV